VPYFSGFSAFKAFIIDAFLRPALNIYIAAGAVNDRGKGGLIIASSASFSFSIFSASSTASFTGSSRWGTVIYLIAKKVEIRDNKTVLKTINYTF
jgi:hypothetical protein